MKRTCWLIGISLVLQACGQTGPLYLPQPQPEPDKVSAK
ncbi:MAG: lipoprotein [Pseudomonadales bacterium]|nr:lipoprotein [Pseudomonadales bacterium]